jgi:hypothetical protein
MPYDLYFSLVIVLEIASILTIVAISIIWQQTIGDKDMPTEGASVLTAILLGLFVIAQFQIMEIVKINGCQ